MLTHAPPPRRARRRRAPQLPVTHAFDDPALYPDLSGRSEVRVLLLGDSGVAAGFGPVAAAAATVCFDPARGAPCDLALLLGDNVYETGFVAPGEQAWIDAFATPMAPFVPAARGDARFRAWVVAGNHDWGNGMVPDGAARVAASIATTTVPENLAIGGLWQHPSLVYAVPGLPAWLHLVAVDTERVVDGAGAPVLDATRAALRATEGWEVVFGHHPPVTSGVHGASPERADETWAGALQGLRADGLSMVLAGHDHHQEVLVSGGVPVFIQGNSSKGRPLVPTRYARCSRWSRGGATERGFAIATFTAEAAEVAFFDGDGRALHTERFARDAVGGKAGRIGRCPKTPAPTAP